MVQTLIREGTERARRRQAISDEVKSWEERRHRAAGQMAEVQRRVDGQDDVRLVSLTVDPRTDTPSVLARFAARFGADTDRWLFLTGDRAVLYPLIETSFLPKDIEGGYRPMPGEFGHTDRIALVDPRGKVRAYFDGMSAGTPAALVAELDRLRSDPSFR